MRDRLLRAALNLVPAPIGRHLMFVLRSNPAISDRWDHHIRPIHYYEPLPDFREITSGAVTARRGFSGIDFAIEAQCHLQRQLGETWGAELQVLAERGTAGFDFGNAYFGGFDAALYYALIRELRPRRVIEIGSGFSTRIAAKAAEANRETGHHTAITCVEPFPQPRLTEAALAIELVTERVEHLPLEFFDVLDANDILFIDSSHAVKFGGDVCREFLEILPRLKPGVWVHVHDIFFPHDYPAEWLTARRYAWTEQYLLEAFLSFNRSFQAACALQWLWVDHPADVHAAWPAAVLAGTGPQGPGSFWMRRVA